MSKYRKAIVAALMLAVYAVGQALGVDTGINVDQWAQTLVWGLLTAGGVYAVPNAPLYPPDPQDGPDA